MRKVLVSRHRCVCSRGVLKEGPTCRAGCRKGPLRHLQPRAALLQLPDPPRWARVMRVVQGLTISLVCVCVCVFDSTGQFLGCSRNSNSTDFKNKGRNPEPFCENSQGKLFRYYVFLSPSLPSFHPSCGMCFLSTLRAALLWGYWTAFKQKL